MNKIKGITGTVISMCMAASCTLGTNLAVSADDPPAETTNTYTLTIPSTLTVANSGWNSIGNISATGSLTEGMKLTVTASSDGEFALVNLGKTDQKITYTIKNAEADENATTSWEFTTLSSTTENKPIGIVVGDFTSVEAGTYTDTVTFAAKVVKSEITPVG